MFFTPHREARGQDIFDIPSLIIKKDKRWCTKRNLPQNGTKVIRVDRTSGYNTKRCNKRCNQHLCKSSTADLNSRKLVQQLKLGVVMFFLGSPVVIFLIGMGVDDRHPVHYMNVGKSYQASQIRYEK